MQKTILVQLKGRDQIKAVAAGLQEIVDAGGSAVFSFSSSDRALVLITPSLNEIEDNKSVVDERLDQNPFTLTAKDGDKMGPWLTLLSGNHEHHESTRKHRDNAEF